MAHDDQRNWTASPEDMLSPVGCLARRVVSVLNERQACQTSAARPYISRILDRRITSRSPFDAAELLFELRGFRLADDVIIDNYIPVAARAIGERWVADQLGFADVTIAAARLQALLTEIAYTNDPALPQSGDPSCYLVVITPGEQHTLGGFVLAAQLRRMGVIVDVLCAEDWPEIDNAIASSAPDAVLFSTSRLCALESIRKIVRTAKTRSGPTPHFCLGGIALDIGSNLQRRSGVDMVSNDVKTVVAYCEQRSGAFPDLAY